MFAVKEGKEQHVAINISLLWSKNEVGLKFECAENNQVEEFRNGTQEEWLTALGQRTGRVFYRHGTH
jgi:hypothetical protein